jgi:GR25 family glycosyltransferase involved in LPS biosynthesis
MINLDERPEKFSQSVQQLIPYGIYPYRFSAVNGWEGLSLEDINDVGVKYGPWMTKDHWATSYQRNDDNELEPHHEMIHEIGRTYFGHCMSRGAIGIVLSHLSILKDAYDSGYETIWVMEDDIQVIHDPRILPDLIEELDHCVGKEKWDILFTDPDTKNRAGEYIPCSAFAWRPNFAPKDPLKFTGKQDINAHFKWVGSRYGAYSMIIRRSGMKKLLNFFSRYQIFLPFDLEYTLPPDMHLFSLKWDVVSTLPTAASDNGAPSYKKTNSL